MAERAAAQVPEVPTQAPKPLPVQRQGEGPMGEDETIDVESFPFDQVSDARLAALIRNHDNRVREPEKFGTPFKQWFYENLVTAKVAHLSMSNGYCSRARHRRPRETCMEAHVVKSIVVIIMYVIKAGLNLRGLPFY